MRQASGCVPEALGPVRLSPSDATSWRNVLAIVIHRYAQMMRTCFKHGTGSHALRPSRGLKDVSCTLQEGAAMPLVATGLLQHEAKLSVLNFGIKKVAACGAPVANKDELLFVSGVRCALPAGRNSACAAPLPPC